MKLPDRFQPSAAAVKALREESGAGMMECKRQLVLEQLAIEIEGFAQTPACPAQLADILRALFVIARDKI